MKKIIWFLISIAGAIAFSFIALARDESINAIWFIVAAVCIYLIAYRFYAAWIAAKALVIDSSKITPSVRNNDGKDFIPTDKWIVFGHHFAAIAGPGPLVGPTLAAQFGYLPGTIWILVGGVLGGAVQDMSVLFFSIRKNGKSLGQMARDELSKLAEITNLIEESFLSKGKTELLIELEKEEYDSVLNHFRELDRNKDKFTISISDVNFNFVLKK